MTIVVGTDFSPCSETAVRLAAIEARRRGLPLVLVSAVETPPLDLNAAPLGTFAWEKEMLSNAELTIERVADELRKDGLAVETRVLVGAPASIIVDTARERQAELIVVGTHGRKGAARLFLGSVADRVVRSSPCPVLVTPEAAQRPDR